VVFEFDVSDLPVEFVQQLMALGPDDEIALVNEAREVAIVVASPRVYVGQVTPASAPTTVRPPNHPGMKVVATGMRLTERVRVFLSTALGTDYAVVDIRSAPESIDALLVPPISAQALAILAAQYPSARIIVTEFDDPESGAWVPGPVTRAMAAGAHAYLTPETLADLASEVLTVLEPRPDRTLPSGSRWTGSLPELKS
jgi:hypothetical protein